MTKTREEEEREKEREREFERELREDPWAAICRMTETIAHTAASIKNKEGEHPAICLLFRRDEETGRFSPGPVIEMNDILRAIGAAEPRLAAMLEEDDGYAAKRFYERAIRSACDSLRPHLVVLIREAWALGVDSKDFKAISGDFPVSAHPDRRDVIMIHVESLWGCGMKLLPVDVGIDGRPVVFVKPGFDFNEMGGASTGFLPETRMDTPEGSLS